MKKNHPAISLFVNCETQHSGILYLALTLPTARAAFCPGGPMRYLTTTGYNLRVFAGDLEE
jgi:hypothetical protein